MNCELIFVGTELLLGDIVNTNAVFLSKQLASLGIDVMYQHVVGDNVERLTGALSDSLKRSSLVITTGGLGPTADDLTKETVASVLGLELEEDAEEMKKIEDFFSSRGLDMPVSNRKQALIPKGAAVLKNDRGTAPGCFVRAGEKAVAVLPGPPREMKNMFLKELLPVLKGMSDHVILSHTVRTFGIGESALAQKCADLLEGKNPTVAPYAKSGEALLRVTAKGKDEAECEALISPVIEEIRSRLGDLVYGVDLDCVEQAAVPLLMERSLTVAAAESCTGGLIAKRLSDVPGSSAVLRCGFVTYQTDTKTSLLGVDADIIKEHTVVSPEVARAMAEGACRASGADLAVAVTGAAGPGTDEYGTPVGLIYICLFDGSSFTEKKLFTSRGDREYNRTVAASNAINMLRMYALEKKRPA